MKTYVFLYDKFANFEIAPLLLFLREKSEVITFSFERGFQSCEEQLKVVVDRSIDEVDANDVDLLVIPGGNPEPYKDRTDFHDFLRSVNANGRLIAAICGGPGFLAHAGLLNGKRIAHGYAPEDAPRVFDGSIITDEDVIVEGNIITARGQAYAEFAVEVYRKLGFFKDEHEARETLDWLKNSR
ncbi:MAG: DJ-1/PfpI family protein [Candidatus Thorarchaeota archaeon]|nr:DJ-1/PfpI family protein [Candidatus Thorarchaeota archaeon]